MNITLTDTLGIITAFQLFFLTIYLITYKKGDRTGRWILVAFLFVNVLIVIRFLVFHLGLIPNSFYPPIHAIGSALYLALAQLLYLYTKNLGARDVQWSRKGVLHAIPFILMVVYAITTYHWLPGVFASANSVLFSYILIHGLLFVYIVATFSQVQRYRIELKEHFSDSHQVNINWLNLLLAAFALMWFIDVIIIVLFFLGFRNMFWIERLGNLSMLINLSFAMCLVYQGLKKPNLFTGIAVVLKSKPSELSKAQVRRYLEKLQNVMMEEKPYLEPMLTIHGLSERTSIPVRHLSWVINKSLNQNFFDFISNYRIEETKRLLLEPESQKYSILGIALEVGFRSKSSFNLLFKKKTGLTPTEFRQNYRPTRSNH